MSFIDNRKDVSDWLIHFVRDRVPDVDFHFATENDDSRWYGGIEPDAPAQHVLRHIVETGGLLPGFSFREVRSYGSVSIKTTIYGGQPAVCFTEAPLQDFARYVEARAARDKCAPYGVCLLKREAFAAGARPVIYALAGANIPSLTEDNTYRRILNSAQLPLAEQFRYVAYDPNRERPLDWTHEREWRWIATDDTRHSVWHHGPQGVGGYPGLPLFNGRRHEGYFSRVGFITCNRDEANELSADLLRYRDSGRNNWGTICDSDVLANSFVIPLNEALASGSARIEDLAPRFLVVASRPQPTADMIERARVAVAKARAVATATSQGILERRESRNDVCGGAMVVTEEGGSNILAALLAAGLATPVGGLFYHVYATDRIKNAPQDLWFHEAVADAACRSLCTDLGDIFYVKTYWD